MPDRKTRMLQMCNPEAFRPKPKPPSFNVQKPDDKVRSWLVRTEDVDHTECASPISSLAPSIDLPDWFGNTPAVDRNDAAPIPKAVVHDSPTETMSNSTTRNCHPNRKRKAVDVKSITNHKVSIIASNSITPPSSECLQVSYLDKSPVRSGTEGLTLETTAEVFSPKSNTTEQSVIGHSSPKARRQLFAPHQDTTSDAPSTTGNNNQQHEILEFTLAENVVPVSDSAHVVETGLIADGEELLLVPLDDDLLEIVGASQIIDSTLEDLPGNDASESLVASQQSDSDTNSDEEPKKRVSNPSKWKKNIMKKKRNKGEAYTTQKGVHKQGVSMGPPCDCKHGCKEKISENERKEIFDKFRQLADAHLQWEFMAKCIEYSPVKKRTTENDPVRNNSYKYKFLNNQNDYVYVCRDMFLRTLSVSSTRIKTCMSKLIRKKGVVSPDKRGKHAKLKASSKAIKASVIDHINKFPRVESHYCRQTSKLKYLDEHLSVRKMHSLYAMEHPNGSPTAATLRQYQDIFKSEFSHKLKFFKPKKDQCSKCLVFNTLSEGEKEKHQDGQEKHLSNKTTVRELKKSDIIEATTNPALCVCTFDLEKTLYSPKGEDALFYYLSKLKSYNFTIFNSVAQKGYCYVWDETTAHRGANEFASCLYIFIQEKVKEGVTEFRFYSDNCGAQNKNQTLFSMYNFVSHKFGVTITHRYLEVGHTQMECDSMHALIERRSKRVPVYAPSQWYAIIRTAKVSAPRYDVKEMSQNDFFDFAPISEQHNWSRVQTSKVREIRVFKNEVKFKKEFNDAPQTAKVLKARPGRPTNWGSVELKPAYSERLPVAHRVLEGLKGLCRKGSIPPTYHDFYNSIPALPPIPKNKKGKQAQQRNMAPNANEEEDADDVHEIEEDELDENEDDASENGGGDAAANGDPDGNAYSADSNEDEGEMSESEVD